MERNDILNIIKQLCVQQEQKNLKNLAENNIMMKQQNLPIGSKIVVPKRIAPDSEQFKKFAENWLKLVKQILFKKM